MINQISILSLLIIILFFSCVFFFFFSSSLMNPNCTETMRGSHTRALLSSTGPLYWVGYVRALAGRERAEVEDQ
jgi:hypothetical protein